MLSPSSCWRLIVTAAPLVCFGYWLLAAPEQVLSQEMTWDLLFNLAGAWHMHTGQVPYADFHDAIGSLYFALTALGFQVVGVTPRAFLFGVGLMLVFVFVNAAAVASRRLPLLPAWLFVVFCSLLVLVPANLGDQPNAYSFAMAYNRYGWSVSTVLFLLLFLPPRQSAQQDARFGPWLDIALGAAILFVLFHLKITYAAVGVAGLVVALVISPHVRGKAGIWVAVLGLLLAHALTSSNQAYLSDIWQASSSQIRATLLEYLRTILSNKEEYALLGGIFLALLWLHRERRVPASSVIAAAFLIAMAGLVLSQNSQAAGMPYSIVMLCLLYDGMIHQSWPLGLTPQRQQLLLIALLLPPLLSVLSAGATLIGYHRKALQAPALFTIAETNLRGLTVPRERDGLLQPFAQGAGTAEHFSQARALRPRYELSQFEYVQTILEAAALLTEMSHERSRVSLLDQVNPLPFVLGAPAPRGANLWNGGGVPMRSAEQALGDADLVLIPKFPTYAASTADQVQQYDDYLANYFPHRRESGSWIVLSRTGLPESVAAQAHPLPDPIH